MFRFIEFLNEPSQDNIKAAYAASGCKTRVEFGSVLGLNKNTVAGWFSNPDSDRFRRPNLQTWNLMLYELEARRLGFNDLKELMEILA